MDIPTQIQAFLAELPESKGKEVETLQRLILQASPNARLWFFDGKNEEGKIVANPNIGYGFFMIKYANGDTKEWFQIGISPNKTGISVYILGLEDKTYLAKTFGEKIGKASVTGYCIKFKSLKDIRMEVLEEAIRFGLEGR